MEFSQSAWVLFGWILYVLVTEPAVDRRGLDGILQRLGWGVTCLSVADAATNDVLTALLAL